MDSRRKLAHQAGALYFVFALLAVVNEFLVPSLIVTGDAAATAAAITAGEGTYRVALLLTVVTLVFFIVVANHLYQLLHEVDRLLARLMVLLVAVGVAAEFANLLLEFAPLVLLGDGESLSAIPASEREALALGFVSMHGSAAYVSVVFWGLWLFPFGVLVARSGFLPRLLGILLLVAGVGYTATSVSGIAFPEVRATVNTLMMPLYVGELPIIFWLMIKGARPLRTATPVIPSVPA